MTGSGPVETPAGRRMIAELQYAHRPLRADVEVLGRALDMLSDATADLSVVPEMISGLTVADFVWQLRVNCDFYCNTLTLHHTIEDQRMFPTMLRVFPELGPVIERLHAEHEDVSGLVAEAKSAALNLTAELGSVDRARRAVAALAEHLRAHLDYEEASLFPYFRRMDTDWHYG